MVELSRRRVLQGAAAAVVVGVVADPARAGDVAADDKTLLERSPRPVNLESPMSTFTDRITPLERFYVRNHFDAPTIDPATWTMTIDGDVATPLTLTLADLQKMPQHTVEAVLQCAGNGRGLMEPRVPGVQWQRGAMGNARWTGVRVSDLIKGVGPKPGSTIVELAGLDKPVMPTTPSFIRALPLDKVMHEDSLVALTMNGKPLPALHGGPARLVTPGWVADGWTKWLARMTIQATEPKGFFWEKAYRYPSTPGAAGAAVAAELMQPMHAHPVKSLVATPARGDVVAPGKVTVRGVAFSGGGHGIRQVDVSMDGTTWIKAKIVDAGGPYGFHVFEHAFEVKKPGPVTFHTRATDNSGAVQPAEAIWNPSGYLHNAIDQVTVEVRA